MSNSNSTESLNELTEAFNSLYLQSPIVKPININFPTMAPPTLDLKVFSIVPIFDGSPNKLKKFINSCQTIIGQYADNDNPDNFQNSLIHHSILNKLTGRAEEVIDIHNPKNWNTVKSLLIQNFSDLRDENSLTRDLTLLKQNNDTPQIFFEKITKVLSTLCNYVEIHNTDEAQKQCKREIFTNQALKTFLAGLREPLGSTIRAMKPDSLSEAMQFIIEEQNISYLQKPQVSNNFKNLTQHQNTKMQLKSVKPNFYYTKPSTSKQEFHQNSHFQNYQSQNHFPSQPIEIKQNPNYKPPKFHTNATVFGKNTQNKNVFKPNPKQNQNFEKPTPMSISTTASKNPRQFPQQFTSKPQQQKYVFEELYNISDEEQIEPDFDQTENENDDENYDEFYSQNFQLAPTDQQIT